MQISEKIVHKNAFEINLYLEGVFWVAYEQSAYYFWQLKAYKPTKKYVKAVQTEVVTVGFPGNILKEIEEAGKQQAEGRKHIVFELDNAIDESDFLTWKEGLDTEPPLHAQAKALPPAEGNTVIEQIKNFDMLSKNPMECMLFLSKIKQELQQ